MMRIVVNFGVGLFYLEVGVEGFNIKFIVIVDFFDYVCVNVKDFEYMSSGIVENDDC